MIFRVFCCASARWGNRKPVVRPAAATLEILTNFLRLTFLDMTMLLSEGSYGEMGDGVRSLIFGFYQKPNIKDLTPSPIKNKRADPLGIIGALRVASGPRIAPGLCSILQRWCQRYCAPPARRI